jgi:hypothetical protein
VAASSTDEAGSPADIAVVLSAPSGQTVTVNYLVASGSTAQASDYTLPTTQTLTFVPGQTIQYIPVTIIDDGIFEPNEKLRLSLSSPSASAQLGGIMTSTLTIVQHGMLPQVAFNSTGAANPSSTTTFNIPVTVTGAFLGENVTVNYSVLVVSSSAAGNSVDYTLQNGTLTFAPSTGTTSQTQDITLSITSDSSADANETIIIELSSPTNGVLGSNQFFTYTIQ